MSCTKPCPKCGRPMRTYSKHEVCSACHEKEPVPRYQPCIRCGGPVALWSKHYVCFKCRKKEYAKTPHGGRRKGKRPVSTGKMCTCKMPNCRKQFELAEWQDERYTWYCPECRAQVSEITTGVLWLSSWGIYLGPESDILMGSVADAYKEDEHETLLLQADRPGPAPGPNLQGQAAGGQQEKGRGGNDIRPSHRGSEGDAEVPGTA